MKLLVTGLPASSGFTRPGACSSAMQQGDVPDTCADVAALAQDVGYLPTTEIEEGISRFVDWYRSYYRV